MLLKDYFCTLFKKFGVLRQSDQVPTVTKVEFVSALCELLTDFEAVDMDSDKFMHDLCGKLNVEDTKTYRKLFKRMWKKATVQKLFVQQILRNNRKVENYKSEEYNADKLYQEFAEDLYNSIGYRKSQSGIGQAALKCYDREDVVDSSTDEVIIYIHDTYESSESRGTKV